MDTDGDMKSNGPTSLLIYNLFVKIHTKQL